MITFIIVFPIIYFAISTLISYLMLFYDYDDGCIAKIKTKKEFWIAIIPTFYMWFKLYRFYKTLK